MTADAAAPLALTLLLLAAVALRVTDRDPPAPPRATSPDPPIRVLDVIPSTIDGVDGMVVRMPWCAAPVGVLRVPAWLSSVDLRALSWPGHDGATVYGYLGRPLPETGTGVLVTAMHGGLRLARALGRAAPFPDEVLKLVVPAACRSEAVRRVPEVTAQIDSLPRPARSQPAE